MPAGEGVTGDYRAEAKKVLQRAAGASGALLAILATVLALNFQVSRLWTEVRLPLWEVVVVGLALMFIWAFAGIYLFRRQVHLMATISYWRSYASNLAATVSRLEDLAFYDPITGLPNINALRRELTGKSQPDLCLILLDLRGFGDINKIHGHWVGDEYLRTFSGMLLSDSRRNEYVYVKTKNLPEDSGQSEQDLRAFRRSGGADEFYVLLNGTIFDGLGYLNRLLGRRKDFDSMAVKLLGSRSPYPFGFRAGLIMLGKDETFDSATSKVEICLKRTMQEDTQYLVDWSRQHDNPMTPLDFDDQRFEKGTREGNILEAAREKFAAPRPPTP